ncbi:metal ABC transporter solute-binding protein [Sporolactobacillus pectinivorans]|uniref:metal ABC transporter solute-binding protein n=1 Tax=Sporolactobacillus pectinivorans TaxID=1591408 RepID=UPI000C263FBE|nr:metal ABC transporter solute-binding protein [Sporolactobacillus pectinivorans]
MREQKFVSRFVLLMGCIVLLIGILTGCGHSNAAGSGSTAKINAVAAEDFYGEVIKAVGGNQVNVTSLINKPSVDPHSYEPTTEAAKAVNQAKLVVYDGLGYDGWMDNLIKNGSNQAVIRVGEDLMNKKDGDNEHLWYQPDAMPKLANDVAVKLGQIDPKNAALFKENAKKFIVSIKPVKDEIVHLSKNSDGKSVDVSEPVFDYTLDALGYKVADNHFALAVDQESDPSPKDIADMQKDIKGKRIAFFVCNIQNIDPTVDKMVTLCKQYGVPVINVTETLPTGKNYKTWMMGELKQVEATQTGK